MRSLEACLSYQHFELSLISLLCVRVKRRPARFCLIFYPVFGLFQPKFKPTSSPSEGGRSMTTPPSCQKHTVAKKKGYKDTNVIPKKTTVNSRKHKVTVKTNSKVILVWNE